MKSEKKATAAATLKAPILILEARFYEAMCDELCNGAIAAIERAGATWGRMAVPGALDLPGGMTLSGIPDPYAGYDDLGC